MTIKKWINDEGGISKASRILGVPQATVWSWYHLKRFPRPRQQERIKKLSINRVSIDIWRADFLARNDKNDNYSIDGRVAKLSK